MRTMNQKAHQQKLVKARREARKFRKIASDLLEMLEEWNSHEDGQSGFSGMWAVTRAEKALKRPST